MSEAKVEAGWIISKAYCACEGLREDMSKHLRKNGELAVLVLKHMSEHVAEYGAR